MADRINIASLDLDVNALIRSTTEVKHAIDVIRAQQKELTKDGKTSSAQFIQNSADLKTLTSAYNANLKAITDSTQATADQANRTELLELALKAEAVSIKEAREQNSLLNKLRNEANATTAEGQAEITRLNAKLDENNEFIKANADAYLQQKINIGNYTESIQTALANINPLNGGMSGFIQRSQEAGGVGNMLKSSFTAMSQGIGAATKASLAFIATPLGAVITAIVIAVTLIYQAFKQFQPIVDKVEQAMAGLSAVFSVVKNLVIGLVTGTKSLGSAFSDLGGDMEDAYKSAVRLKQAQQDLEDAMEGQEIASAKARVEINKLNIQAKDRTKTEEERLALLRKAEAIERADFEARRKNADQALANAKEDLRINGELSNAEIKMLETNYTKAKELIEKKTGNVDEYLERYRDAVLAQTEIDNEATSNLEKNINKQNKLIEDAEAKAEKAREEAIKRQEEAEQRRQKLLDQALEKQQLELDLFISSQGFKAKSMEEEAKLADEIYKKQLAINQAEFNASEKTANDKLKLEIANNDAKNALMEKQRDIVIANVERELELYINANKSKLDADKFLTDELVAEESRRLELIAEKRREAEAVRLAEGVINEQAYNDAINQINSENQTKLDELAEQRAIAKAETEALNLENKRALDDINFANDFEYKAQQLEQQRIQEVANAQNKEAEIFAINQRYAKLQEGLEKQKKIAQIEQQQQAVQVLGGLATQFFGDSKALTSALALADTYLSAQKAYLSQFLPIPDITSPVRGANAAAIAIAGGLANVAKINQVGAKFEQGGFIEINGKSHKQGGEPVFIGNQYIGEAQGGEGVAILNRNAFGVINGLNSTYPDGVSTPSFFAGGGVITQAVKPSGVDAQQLAQITIEAIKLMPAPIVTVEDINSGVNNYVQVVDGANF